MSLVSKLLMQKILTGKTMSTATWELTLCENQLHLINQKFRKMLTGNRLLEERLLFWGFSATLLINNYLSLLNACVQFYSIFDVMMEEILFSRWWTNPLSANPTKWLNILKQFVGCCRRIVWVSLTILWDWCLTLNVPCISESCIETKVKFLFSHFFVVPQKGFEAPQRSVEIKI